MLRKRGSISRNPNAFAFRIGQKLMILQYLLSVKLLRIPEKNKSRRKEPSCSLLLLR